MEYDINHWSTGQITKKKRPKGRFTGFIFRLIYSKFKSEGQNIPRSAICGYTAIGKYNID